VAFSFKPANSLDKNGSGAIALTRQQSLVASAPLMKWTSLLIVAALALFANACERHSAEETSSALEEDGKPSETAQSAPGEATTTSTEKPASTESAKPSGEKPAGESADKAPKFFDSK
jgi:hypothetical protein